MIRQFLVPAFIVAVGLSVLPAHAHATRSAKSHARHGGTHTPNLDATVTMYNLYLQSMDMDAQAYDAAKDLYDTAESDTDRQNAQAQIDKAQLSLMSDVLKSQKLLNVLLADKRLMHFYRFGTTLQVARAYPSSLPLSTRRKIVTRPLIAYPRVVVEH